MNNWNGIVSGKDTVIHLGDFSYGSKTTVFNLTSQLTGNLFLVRGNHDKKDKEWYDDCRITLLDSFLVRNGKYKFLFTHRPARYVPADTINIHGHLHNKCPLFWQNGTGSKHINVSVEAVRYRPVKLGDIIEMSGFLN